jgi:hypothetical protein
MAEFHLARGGQTVGIYPEEQLRAFWAEGRVVAEDLVWRAGMPGWLPAGRIFGSAPPLPPKLHWGWVLLLTVLTVGLFYVIWAFVQAVWIRRIDANSRAVPMLVVYVVLAVIGELIGDTSARNSQMILGALLSLTGMVVSIFAYFSMRKSLLAYYNEVEPIGLKLSRWMTLIFNVLYFQHHLTKIANRSALPRP